MRNLGDGELGDGVPGDDGQGLSADDVRQVLGLDPVGRRQSDRDVRVWLNASRARVIELEEEVGELQQALHRSEQLREGALTDVRHLTTELRRYERITPKLRRAMLRFYTLLLLWSRHGRTSSTELDRLAREHAPWLSTDPETVDTYIALSHGGGQLG